MIDPHLVAGWCVGAGHTVAPTPDSDVLTLTLRGSHASARIEPPGADGPVCFVALVTVDATPLDPTALDDVLALVELSRGPLVEISSRPAGSVDAVSAEVRVSIYQDGLTRHAVLAALDELTKSCGAAREAIVMAHQEQLLRAVLSEGATSPGHTTTWSPPPDPEPAAAGAVAQPVPHWCYVTRVVELRDLTATDRVIGHLEPGAWYEALDERGGWRRVRATDGPIEGWADASLVYLDGDS